MADERMRLYQKRTLESVGLVTCSCKLADMNAGN